MIKAIKVRKSRIRQGDIIRDVEYIESIHETRGILEIKKVVFPLVIVLTQDCDLQQDFDYRAMGEDANSQDKYLLSVLVAPIYNAEHVHSGEHLSDLHLTMQIISKKGSTGNFFKQNMNPRYHYLEFAKEIPIVPSVVDFKHYFSVNVRYLSSIRRKNWVCHVPPVFREHLSHRFTSFLSRIGLPDLRS